MRINQDINALVDLLKYGIGNSTDYQGIDSIQWEQIMRLAQMQGIGAIVFKGVEKLYNSSCLREENKLSWDVLSDWVGQVRQQEKRYAMQVDIIEELATFYQEHGIRMMVLKGWGLSLLYPQPEHRPCSDLDIYLFGEQKRGDRLIHELKDIEIDNTHHHHSVFIFKGLGVENHYDFLNVHAHLSSRKIEKRLKEMAKDAVPVRIQDAEVWLPSVDFNALFVLRHAAAHFAGSEMSLRQVVDWGFFLKKNHQLVNWEVLLPFLKELNMHHFLGAINYICYHYLGFERSVFEAYIDEEYGERVFEDLFNPENSKPKQKGFIKYIYSRYKKWWGNRWKHRIVYPEGLLVTFLVQVVSHLMKPSTLYHK